MWDLDTINRMNAPKPNPQLRLIDLALEVNQDSLLDAKTKRRQLRQILNQMRDNV